MKALLFDCDGLLIDTETPWYHAFCELYDGYGQKLPMEKYLHCVGTHFNQSFDPYTYLCHLMQKPLSKENMEQQVGDIHHRLMEKEQLRPGVLQYLKQAKQMGLKLGLASSSNRAWVMRHLERFDIAGYFDSIMTSDDVDKVKPDPELYLRSLQHLHILANEAIVFEDSKNGCLAAKAADIFTVWIPNEMTRHIAFDEYDLELTSMEAMSLDDLIGAVKGSH